MARVLRSRKEESQWSVTSVKAAWMPVVNIYGKEGLKQGRQDSPALSQWPIAASRSCLRLVSIAGNRRRVLIQAFPGSSSRARNQVAERQGGSFAWKKAHAPGGPWATRVAKQARLQPSSKLSGFETKSK